MALHEQLRYQIQKRSHGRRRVGMVLVSAALVILARGLADMRGSRDRVPLVVVCGCLAGVGVFSYVRGRKLPATEIMRFAESRGGVVTLSEIATTLDVDPEVVVRTLRRLEKLGVAVHRWEELRRNLWEFPDYSQVPAPEALHPMETARPAPREQPREALSLLQRAPVPHATAGEAARENAPTLLAAAP